MKVREQIEMLRELERASTFLLAALQMNQGGQVPAKLVEEARCRVSNAVSDLATDIDTASMRWRRRGG
jgi:hypothetical protein